MHRCLVVANRTLGGDHLVQAMRERAGREPTRFHVLVPVVHPADHVWTEGEITAEARHRLEDALERFRALGFEVTGEVGDHMVVDAIAHALRSQPTDEIILSTLPPGASRWLRADLPSRVRRSFPLPVTHIVASPETVAPRL